MGDDRVSIHHWRIEALALRLTDGRQSPTALKIQRGVCRLMAGLGQVSVTELTLASGRRADVIALSPAGDITIVEVKSSLADFRADTKWRDYHAFSDYLFFAVAEDFPIEVLPEEAGLIVADAYGAAILRSPERMPLAAARRKAVTIRFAQAAAARLHSLTDPDGAPIALL
ncbi:MULTISPECIES: MmcB family DNA repair protein [unclassified Chelatococcus]|jgi:hypothetical protein|uniref:MmcB family DNA repair protein n=1 Tax=unclassified Chelatococcus TaxID=2638111 RepID=UPI001BCF02B7|nr:MULTISPECIES: MmcB family DNA repair protein [unclassified Chelatococcus]CAH1656484.1 conserved hypothetical protein [Hyphomicrobiales bacterium]MBS7740541.1 MmcB family DNA repair protein [Chelatococcus sp. HY11]MBX3544675.1 MmcB family DNA repair protein [Chelatococcus sp.]MCO5078216.1 MmcB family DNA repair protein [Chelatococcus sp.]CAH1684728.1 conserved hypothetical protein [Hyphomicrobiales bacterium]